MAQQGFRVQNGFRVRRVSGQKGFRKRGLACDPSLPRV